MSLLENVEANRSVIPDYCVSFEEEAMYVQEFAEANVTSFLEEVGISELAVFESTGELVVYEDGNDRGIKDKAKELLQKIWAVIKAAYEKVLAFFASHAINAAKKFKGLKESDVDLLPEKTKFKVHNFKLDEKFADNADSVKRQIETKIENGEDVDFDNDFIVKAITGTAEGSAQKAKKAIRDTMLGQQKEVGVDFVKSNWSDIYNVVIKGIDKKSLKKPYKDEKAVIEKSIKNIKGMKNLDNINKIVKLYSKISTTLRALNALKIDVMKKRLVEYTRIVAKVYARKSVVEAENKKKEKKTTATTESFFGYQEDMIKEAFDW